MERFEPLINLVVVVAFLWALSTLGPRLELRLRANNPAWPIWKNEKRLGGVVSACVISVFVVFALLLNLLNSAISQG
jgi:sterol desaturase/sphingolipid hydroxylase (fatty acid hydroxylase superfamily)